jgi:hypothetical protein
MIGIGEGLFEMYGIHQGMFLYYGAQPFPLLGFPLYLGFVNPTLATGFAESSAVWFHFARGGMRYLLIPLTPFLFFGIYASVVTPVAAALHSGNPVLAAASGLCATAASLSLATIAFWTLRKLQSVNRYSS